MTIKHYAIRYYNHEGGVLGLLVESEGKQVTRDYDFNAEDRRVTEGGPLTSVARERAQLTGKLQQARLVDGPLLGRKIWLIQSTDVDIEPRFKGRDDVVIYLGDTVRSFQSGRIGKVVEIVRDAVAVEWSESPSPDLDLGLQRNVLKSNLEPYVEPRFKPGDLVLSRLLGTIRRRRDDGLWEILYDGHGLGREGSAVSHPSSPRPGIDVGDEIIGLEVDRANAILLPRA